MPSFDGALRRQRKAHEERLLRSEVESARRLEHQETVMKGLGFRVDMACLRFCCRCCFRAESVRVWALGLGIVYGLIGLS